ncbi:MAG: hypothetical protein ABJH05_15970 [Fulvivirga sp.]
MKNLFVAALIVLTGCSADDCCNLPSETDPYQIKDVKISEDHTLLVEVAYSGGCQEHSFEIEWPEAITAIYPPNFSVVLYHDANGDNCEAFITETLEFSFDDSNLGLSDEAIQDMTITVINASNTSQQVSNK